VLSGFFGRPTAIIDCFDAITPRNGDARQECDHRAAREMISKSPLPKRPFVDPPRPSAVDRPGIG